MYSVKLNDNCDDTQSNHSEDVFRGVRYKRNARYYVSGIDRESNKHGILRYIENKGVKVTHMVMFKPRTPRSQLRDEDTMYRYLMPVSLSSMTFGRMELSVADGTATESGKRDALDRNAVRAMMDFDRGYNSNSRYMDDNSYAYRSRDNREWWREYDNDQDIC